MTPEVLLPLAPAGLQRRMDAGHPVFAADLAGAWYRGVSLGLWGWVESITWKTFAKAFHARDGEVRGWNIRIHQDGLGAAPRPRSRGGLPHVFGHYTACDGPGGVVLDYGRGPNPRFDPVRLVRDPLVALVAGDPTVLLGRTWLQVGSARVPTPSFFLLERCGPIPEDVLAAAIR